MDADRIQPLAFLKKAWFNLRLSVRCPSRVPTWDAIVVTASSPEQASLYQWHLDQAKRRGTIGADTIALAVPDPQGFRIGSGGATLHALRCLAHLLPIDTLQANVDQSVEASSASHILKMSVLLVHAGGDSKRVPWANPIGKAFLPLPFLAADEPDGPVLSLFDHIVAISSRAVQEFKRKGGLFIMTGDVLPCFDFSNFLTPEDGACVVTVPTGLDMAANHGVILTSSVDGMTTPPGAFILNQENKLELVVDLLQKPTIGELVDSHAVRSEGTVLLDTGIFAVCGKAWSKLMELALEEPDPVSALLHSKKEVSLYEEIAGAWVPARYDWLKARPLGTKLIDAFSQQSLFSYCARRRLVFPTFWDEYRSFGSSCQRLWRTSWAKAHGPGCRQSLFWTCIFSSDSFK